MSEKSTSKPGKRRGGLRKLIPYIIIGAIIAAIVAGLWPKPIEVDTVEISRGPLNVTVLEEGKTRIRNRYIISPPIAGYMNRVELRAGDPIKAGETVLATIKAEISGFLDPRARAQAEARVQAAEAIRMQRQAELERAKSALDLGQKDLDRSDSLLKSGAISRQEWDTADNRVQVLTRELRAIEFSLQVAEFEIEQARAALMQTEGTQPADAQPFKIIAPVDGYVLNVHEESARVVTPGMPIMEVGDPRDIEAEIELLSSDAVAIERGAEVWIEQWGGEQPLRGKVSVIEPGAFTKVSALGVEEQRVRVRVDFVDPMPEGRSLGDRYRVEARIVTWHGENVLQVPTGALFRRGGDWMAFVVADGVAALRKLEIAHNNGVAAEVISGLVEGDAVVVHPPDTIEDGTKVQVNPVE